MAKVALVTVHGMGETKVGYANELIAKLRVMLGPEVADVSFQTVYYQRHLQDNQDELWRRCTRARRLNWQMPRRFMLFNFSDAVGLEAGKDETDSSYHSAQVEVARAMLQARGPTGDDVPVVVLAQSLGGQVFSCYLYDAQRAQRFERKGVGSLPPAGIWRDVKGSLEQALDRVISEDDKDYLRGSTVRAFITTGCNIPIFVAAHKRMSIRPIAKPNDKGFEWHNYFNPNDVLGWPLQPLSDDYNNLVQDHSVRAGNLLKWWNPLSHGEYWTDRVVLDAVASQLKRALAQQRAEQPVALVPPRVAAEL